MIIRIPGGRRPGVPGAAPTRPNVPDARARTGDRGGRPAPPRRWPDTVQDMVRDTVRDMVRAVTASPPVEAFVTSDMIPSDQGTGFEEAAGPPGDHGSIPG